MQPHTTERAATQRRIVDGLSQALSRSPELFPAALDKGGANVGLVRLSEGEYALASFLDGRLYTPTRLKRTVPYSQLEAAVAASGLAERCHYIFHIGHVGSTLLSRLLGAHPRIFSLREPQILRDLAEGAPDDARLTTFLKLWSRTFRAEQTALIKATSFVSEMAAALMARPSSPRALLMYVPAEPFLATILAGENAPAEIMALAPRRIARLCARLGDGLSEPRSIGESIAMSWACEMTALAAAADAAGERALWFDFEAYLAAPGAMLGKAFAHLGAAADEAEVNAILSGPESARYSKAQEHEYDSALRTRLLNEARERHAAEITRGLAWLVQAAGEFPAIGNAMERVMGIEPT